MKFAAYSAVLLSVFGAAAAQQVDCTVITNPTNALSPCNREGRVLSPRLIATSPANNDWNTCRKACNAAANCQSFSYEAARNECKTYRAAIISQLFIAGRTGIRFDSKVCYTEKCTTRPVTSSSTRTTSTSTSTSAPIITTKPTSTSTSTSTSTTPTPTVIACPTASQPTCTDLAVRNNYGNHTVSLKFTGNGVKLATDSPANNNAEKYPPVTSTYPGTQSVCQAAQACADFTWAMGNEPLAFRYTFDLHYMKAAGNWECVTFYDPALDMGTYYTVKDAGVCAAYGYSSGYV